MKFTHLPAVDLHFITYAPIVPVDGQLYFNLAAHVFPAGDKTTTRLPSADGDAWLPHNQPITSDGSVVPDFKKCYIDTSDVPDGELADGICIKDYDLGGGIVKCVRTDIDGKYHVAVPMNSRIYVEISYMNHAFRLDENTVVKDGIPLTEATVDSAPPGQDRNKKVNLNKPPTPNPQRRLRSVFCCAALGNQQRCDSLMDSSVMPCGPALPCVGGCGGPRGSAGLQT